jgi:PhoPQ-activated pathogenicity-related protein
MYLWLLVGGWLSLSASLAAEPAPTSTSPQASITVEQASKALARYVARPDDSYGWKIRRSGTLGSGTYAELTLTSQTWRDAPWRHQLFVYKPAKVDNASQGLLMIGGGRWRDEMAGPVTEADQQLPREAPILAAAAGAIKSPVAVLLHVPHQPILGGMVEDEAISYTFAQFLKTGDPDWPLLLPMVKSAVRGMDAIQQFARQEWSLDIKNFTVTGASKRGWTTWLTSAVDNRVNALAPMVIDVLNMEPQMKHQLETWGKFSEQIEDYTRRGIQSQTSTPQGRVLNTIIDPYSYRQKITQPKLILLGTNDRYWPLDALNLYWDGLKGDRYVCYVPNNGHGLRDVPRIVGALCAIHLNAAGKLQLPELNWKLAERDGALSLHLESDVRPARVSAWIATAPTKDFRQATWTSQPMREANGGFEHQLATPDSGYAAMFGEAMFEHAAAPFFLSTNVKIVGQQTAE